MSHSPGLASLGGESMLDIKRLPCGLSLGLLCTPAALSLSSLWKQVVMAAAEFPRKTTKLCPVPHLFWHQIHSFQGNRLSPSTAPSPSPCRILQSDLPLLGFSENLLSQSRASQVAFLHLIFGCLFCPRSPHKGPALPVQAMGCPDPWGHAGND